MCECVIESVCVCARQRVCEIEREGKRLRNRVWLEYVCVSVRERNRVRSSVCVCAQEKDIAREKEGHRDTNRERTENDEDIAATDA